jgi:death-on-curing protein
MSTGLSLHEVLALHRRALETSGGMDGIRDLGALHSALMQPYMTFGGHDLYATIVDKATALCFSLVMNHPFIDGNKRVGHASLEALLMLNGMEISAPVDEQEGMILGLAGGRTSRTDFASWVRAKAVPLPPEAAS